MSNPPLPAHEEDCAPRRIMELFSVKWTSMERDGLLERRVFQVGPPRVDYSLTPLGRVFIEPIEMLYEWGRTHPEALDDLGIRPRSRRRVASSASRREG